MANAALLSLLEDEGTNLSRITEEAVAHIAGPAELLPRDNKTRLQVRGPHRHAVRNIAATTERLAAEIEALPAEALTPEDEETIRYTMDVASRAILTYSDFVHELVKAEWDALIAHQAAARDHISELSRILEADEPAEEAGPHHHEPRSESPPGPELVARSLAPHAPPSFRLSINKPAGVT